MKKETTNLEPKLRLKLNEAGHAENSVQGKEILDYIKMNKEPQMPGFFCGVIEIMGNMVPVLDMRSKYRMKKNSPCILIGEVDSKGEKKLIGALIDMEAGVNERVN